LRRNRLGSSDGSGRAVDTDPAWPLLRRNSPMFRSPAFYVTAALLLLPALTGCSRSKDTESPQAGSGLEHSAAPPLAEIDAQAQWIDMPVDDALVLLRDEQKTNPPAGTVAEAL